MPPAALPLYRSPALRVFEAAHADHPRKARAGAVAAAWAEALADGGRIHVLAGFVYRCEKGFRRSPRVRFQGRLQIPG